MQIWDRQKGESRQAFEAFSTYLGLPGDSRSDRSHRKVAAKLGKSYQLMDRWAVRWRWSERCESYERYMAQKKRLALEAQQIDAFERHAKLGATMQEKGNRRLALLTEKQLAKLPVAVATNLIVEGVAVERQALGAASESIEVMPPPAATNFLFQDPEAITLVHELLKRKRKAAVVPGDASKPR